MSNAKLDLSNIYNPELHREFNAEVRKVVAALGRMSDLWREDYCDYPGEFLPSLDDVAEVFNSMLEIPREVLVHCGKGGKSSIMTFAGVTPDGFLHCHPRGGGFQYKVPVCDVLEFDCELPVTTYRKIKVFAGDVSWGCYEAWVDDSDKWNGWLKPFLQADEAERFASDQQILHEGELEGEVQSDSEEYRWHQSEEYRWQDGKLQSRISEGDVEPGQPREWENVGEFVHIETSEGIKTVVSLCNGYTWEEWQLQEGDRVELTQDVERYPHFIVPAGCKGTVDSIEIDEHVEGIEQRRVCVKMDENVNGADEWNNCIVWDDGDGVPELCCKLEVE